MKCKCQQNVAGNQNQTLSEFTGEATDKDGCWLVQLWKHCYRRNKPETDQSSTQRVSIPHVFCSTICKKTCHQVCHHKKIGCHQVSWHARVMIDPYPKAGPKVAKHNHITSFGHIDIICWEDVKRIKELQKFCSTVNPEDQVCQAEKKVMSDLYVLVCSDFYSKSTLGEMGINNIKCTGWSHSACSDGSDKMFVTFARIKTLLLWFAMPLQIIAFTAWIFLYSCSDRDGLLHWLRS